ncbi:MAG: hypothetical protein R2911_08750 [Caldilineaceae bacterium]
MTIILDHYRIPETGTFEIRQTVTVNISAQTARRAVNRWLLMTVSTQMGAEEPSLVVNQRTVWRVPARFTAPHVGKVGTVGHVDVDVLTGELLRLDSCQREIEQTATEFAAALPPFQPHTHVPADYLLQGVPSTQQLTVDAEGNIVSRNTTILCSE